MKKIPCENFATFEKGINPGLCINQMHTSIFFIAKLSSRVHVTISKRFTKSPWITPLIHGVEIWQGIQWVALSIALKEMNNSSLFENNIIATIHIAQHKVRTPAWIWIVVFFLTSFNRFPNIFVQLIGGARFFRNFSVSDRSLAIWNTLRIKEDMPKNKETATTLHLFRC